MSSGGVTKDVRGTDGIERIETVVEKVEETEEEREAREEREEEEYRELEEISNLERDITTTLGLLQGIRGEGLSRGVTITLGQVGVNKNDMKGTNIFGWSFFYLSLNNYIK